MRHDIGTTASVWVNLQYLALFLTIVGQVVIGPAWIIGQTLWLLANIVSVARDYALARPRADKVRDIGLTALTAGLIVSSFL